MIGLGGLRPEVRAAASYALDQMQLATGGYALRPGDGRIRGGLRPTVTSGFRTHPEQVALYEARARNPYPVNRPGDSAHEVGLAFDSSVPGPWVPLWTTVRQAVGFRVPPNDPVHAEVPGWRAYRG